MLIQIKNYFYYYFDSIKSVINQIYYYGYPNIYHYITRTKIKEI